mmetsp:Transcript_26247/g.72077  ORF Transcript_26247/g.72077 Transcript_26247/m.72077 type:complete len:80 (-) Transcript_26247:201-440(-)
MLLKRLILLEMHFLCLPHPEFSSLQSVWRHRLLAIADFACKFPQTLLFFIATSTRQKPGIVLLLNQLYLQRDGNGRYVY